MNFLKNDKAALCWLMWESAKTTQLEVLPSLSECCQLEEKSQEYELSYSNLSESPLYNLLQLF